MHDKYFYHELAFAFGRRFDRIVVLIVRAVIYCLMLTRKN